MSAKKNWRDRETADQALERAINHASLALSEGVASGRAILDAASLVASGVAADSQPNLAEIARTLDQIAGALSGESPSLRATAINTLLEAVDSEISRWDLRSRSDENARSVLRVYMGLREVLWELGIRREAPNSPGSRAPADGPAKRSRDRRNHRASSELERVMSELPGDRSNQFTRSRDPSSTPDPTSETDHREPPRSTRAPTPAASVLKPGATPGGRIQRIKIEG